MKQNETAPSPGHRVLASSLTSSLASWSSLSTSALWQALAGAWSSSHPDVAVFVVDGDQTVRAFSPGAERLLGLRAVDVVGEHCRKSNRCQSCMVGCGLRSRGVIDDVPLVLFRDDGVPVPVRKTARAFVSADGRFQGGVEILVPDRAAAQASENSRADSTTTATTATTTEASWRRATLPILDDVLDAPVERSGILTRDPALRRLLDVVDNVARTDVSVLLRGESGTGKELFARLVHEASHRASGPFLAVNCAAVAPTLLESELFGHEKGAFTGAVSTHHGYFERADGGTIFLDEVAELPIDVAAKLLRVLETRTFFRVGGNRPVTVDVRVVSATHKSLRAEAAAGRFREDLLYRLRVVPIFLPPLRDRRVDIPLLVERFVERLNQASAARRGRRIDQVAPDALRALLQWAFPGNVRELKNAVEYAFAVGAGPVLLRVDLPPEIAAGPASSSSTEPARARPTASGAPDGWPPATTTTRARSRGRPPAASDPAEAARLAAALRKSHGDVGAAAAALGMSRATFWRRRRRCGL
jgi:transcriptional regulator with GAF, ATPase, and Fis domain